MPCGIDPNRRSRPAILDRPWVLAGLLLLAGCSVHTIEDPAELYPDWDPDTVSDAVPRAEPRSRYGNPESYVVFGKRYRVLASSRGFVERGQASWYGKKFHGRRTSSGETYDMFKMTAAHKHLPLPTFVQVTNLDNGRQVVVKVNDRGPFHGDRIIDLSYAAATKLGMARQGVGRVEVRAVDTAAATRQAVAARPTVKPAPTTAKADATLLFLQLGAFVDRANAESLQRRVAAKVRHDVGIYPSTDAVTLYRVRLGPFDSVREMDELRGRLREMGLAAPKIIID